MTKSLAQYCHAKKRAFERLRMQLTPDRHRRLVYDIQNNRLEFVDRQSNRVSRWRFWFNGKESFVIYDKKRKSIVTFLPAKPVETFYFVNFND